MLKKIVIIGPESTGKSTLSQQLAAHYNTMWCPEYAREYLLKNGMNYTYDDLLIIAKEQVALEEKYLTSMVNSELAISNKQLATGNNSHSPPTRHPELVEGHHSPIFIDTNMYVMKVWCEFVFGKCHRYILEQIEERKYDLYLLCDIDLPWIKDELREYPELESRQRLYRIYKDIMISQTVPWVEISGSYEQRLEKAIIAIDALLKK